ncbi:hypothetical protein C2G38_1000370 [Gigaspora rosea]|uniref:Uncharacterized protein n=1 Tax=Gigaspora rosea TaxID=44941 RepID=A0A397VIW7_9GLOM|nr:hypothetical protein C2G38_1000370 [Gigaspora rosea]
MICRCYTFLQTAIIKKTIKPLLRPGGRAWDSGPFLAPIVEKLAGCVTEFNMAINVNLSVP